MTRQYAGTPVIHSTWHCARFFVVSVTTYMVCLTAPHAWAQGQGNVRQLFGTTRVSLATLESVQAELQLSDAQKEQIAALHDKYTDQRRALWRTEGEAFATRRAKWDQLVAATTEQLHALLNETQQQRLTELYVQVNGPNALFDRIVAERLQLSDEQRNQLNEARDANFQAMRDAFQNFQNMSDQERQAAFARLRDENAQRLMAPLTEQQKSTFESLKGKAAEIDLTPLYRNRNASSNDRSPDSESE